jgi:hypothetical protein
MADLIEKSRAVYMLWHVAREDTDDEDAKMIGVYSNRRNAERTIAHLVKVVGFRRYPKSFHIDLYRLNETNWAEGFVTYRWKPKVYGRSAKTKR